MSVRPRGLGVTNALKAGAALALASLLLWQGWQTIHLYRGLVPMYQNREPPLLADSDWPAFYAGARLFVSAERERSYNQEAQAREVLRVKGFAPDDLDQDSPWYRYYNPPAYSVFLAPLTLLDLRTAYLVTVAVNVAGLLALLYLIGVILNWRQPLTVFAAGAITVSTPLHYAFWHSQPTILLALAIGWAFVLAERGRTLLAGLLLGLTFIKPQWLTLSSVSLIRTYPRAVLATLFSAAGMVLPFAVIGARGVLDYVHLVFGRGKGDIGDNGFTEALLSWSGFVRAYSGDAMPHAWLALSFVTFALFAFVWLSGNRDHLPLAAMITTLLVVPHSHPQDWLLLVPAACFLLRAQSGLRLILSGAILAGLLLALNDWSGLDGRETAIYWPTLAGFTTLLWLALFALHQDGRLVLGVVAPAETTSQVIDGRASATEPFSPIRPKRLAIRTFSRLSGRARDASGRFY